MLNSECSLSNTKHKTIISKEFQKWNFNVFSSQFQFSPIIVWIFSLNQINLSKYFDHLVEIPNTTGIVIYRCSMCICSLFIATFLMANVLFSPLISIETNHNWMLHVNFSHCAKCLLQLLRHSFVAYSFCMHVRLLYANVNAQNAKNTLLLSQRICGCMKKNATQEIVRSLIPAKSINCSSFAHGEYMNVRESNIFVYYLYLAQLNSGVQRQI